MVRFSGSGLTENEYRERLKARSSGTLRPSSGTRIDGGVYDALIICRGVRHITLNYPTILGEVVIDGDEIEGVVHIPSTSKLPRVGTNTLKVESRTWAVLALLSGVATDSD